MKKFMIFYMADPAAFETMMQNSTPEARKKGMEAWMQWMTAHKASIVEGGSPLGKTMRVDAKGAKDAKNGIGGYSVVQADSHDAAAKMFGKDHPHFQTPGAWVEVVEIMPMPGM
jgi:YCII-related domain